MKSSSAGVGPNQGLSLIPDLSVPPPSLPSTSHPPIPEYPGKKQKKYLRIAAGQVWNDPTLNEWDKDDFRIFCGDLGPEVTDETLIKVFSRFSSFKKAKVVIDKRTRESRGYGFVSFGHPDDFTRAMREVNGKFVGNRPIKLRKSEWQARQLEVHKKKEKEKRKLGLRL
ncbi:RNA-binding protein 42 [Cichlidogyrus casuarinus]|uniref:RNA-binding protein 42 n=1 Tax=Cichlidogyrus casuarinus TaxID=1844966 RepID=A0ABD2QB00_9PLAT